MSKRFIDVWAIPGLAAVYVVAARLGLAFDAVSGFATLVWAPTGISLAALLLLGYRVWPGILLGAAIANALTGASLLVALGIATGNTLEAVAGAYLLRRVPRFRVTLESVPSVVGLIVFSAVLSTLISASVGVTSLYLGNVITGSLLQETWRAWWVGDMVGALLVAPIILVWAVPPRARFRPHWVEVVALVSAVITVSVSTFFNGVAGLPALPTPLHQMDLVFAVLIWAALRFGQRGAATASFWIGATAVAGTASGHGPFVLPELSQSLFLLQTFIALVAATVLLLGAIVAERAIALEQTRQARDEAARASLAKAEFVAVMSAEIFDAVEPLVRPELHRKHFVLKRELARPMLAVQADPDGLRQILVNLLSNASKYTEERGSITLGADRQRNKVCIWVSETGAGIPTELA